MKKQKLFSIECENEIEKKYFCPYPFEYQDLELPGCGKIVDLTINDIIPGRELIMLDEYLCFYWKCPNCGQVRKLDNSFVNKYLSTENQKMLMIKYAGWSDLMREYWNVQKEEYELEKKLYDIRKIKNEIFLGKIQKVLKDSDRDTSRLYPNWDITENILKKTLKKED